MKNKLQQLPCYTIIDCITTNEEYYYYQAKGDNNEEFGTFCYEEGFYKVDEIWVADVFEGETLGYYIATIKNFLDIKIYKKDDIISFFGEIKSPKWL